MKKIVVLTGAGISADSGLKTFRDAGGLWEGHRVEDVATPQAFANNPQLVIDFYNQRRKQLKTAKPNPAHLALVELEKHYEVQIITQNVDNLHEQAGSKNILHMHGELTKLRSTVDDNYVIDCIDDQKTTDCDPSGYPLRPHIVWFGEMVPKLEKAAEIVSQADIVIIIGTSMQVYPAASLINYAKKSANLHLVDPKPTYLTGVNCIAKTAAIGMPLLVQQLIAETDH